MRNFRAALAAALALAFPASATVTGNPPPSVYACNGTTTTYTIAFPYLATSNVVATVTTGGITSTLALTTDYTVSPSVAPSVGTLKLVAGSRCPNGSTLTITRNVALTQPQSFRLGPYNGPASEQAYDRLLMQLQQVDAKATAAINPTPLTVNNNSSVLGLAPQVTRGLADKLGEIVSVKDYGILCNGATDDAAKFATASADAVAKNATLLVNCKVRIASAVGTAAANLRFTGNGALDLSPAGGSVTLTGSIDAPLTQIFYTGSGTLALNGFTKMLYVVPHWWGAVGNGTADDGPALQAAINATGSAGQLRGFVYLPPGTYRYTTPLLHAQDSEIRGSGPKFGGTTLKPDGCAAFKAIGASYSGGFAFRGALRDLVIQPVNTPASTKLVELNNAYSIRFENILLSTVTDNSSIGFDLTDVNEVVFDGVRIDGASNATSKGIVEHVSADKSSVQCLRCDLENLNTGIEVLDASVMDIVAPYLERNIVAIKNSSNMTGSLGGGHVMVLGGIIHCPGASQVCISTSGSAPTTVIGTTLDNAGGTGNKFATGNSSWVNFLDTVNNRWFFGTAPNSSNNLTPASTITLGTENAIGFVGSVFANLGTPANGRIIYCSDCTIANPCAGGGTGAFAKRLAGAWICN